MNLIKKINHLICSIILVFYSYHAIAEEGCKITEQSGSAEAMWCANHNQTGTIRCYAEVRYTDGDINKIWGDACYDSYADCWSSGKGGVEPRCAKY